VNQLWKWVLQFALLWCRKCSRGTDISRHEGCGEMVCKRKKEERIQKFIVCYLWFPRVNIIKAATLRWIEEI